MQESHPWIILFDIDGTLLTVKNNFNRRFIRSLLDEHQVHYPEMEKDSFSGRTDHDIFYSFLVHHDYDEDLYQKVKTAYLKGLGEQLHSEHVDRHEYVDEAIDYFSSEGFVSGLLTGNYPRAATYKLRAANIDYDFTIGAFGEYDKDRNQLPRLALAAVREQMGVEPDPAKFVIIGDTPRDVICARKSGMRCVAVTTGSYDRSALAEHKPDLIIDSLQDPEHWFRALKEV